MIIVDFSQTAIAAVFVFSDEFKKGKDPAKMKQIIRHTVLKSFLVYKREYGKKYGEMVIACDGRQSWRKNAFKHYKAHRAKNRSESDIDWDSVFPAMDEIKQDLKNIFPWVVIDIDSAEGDDVIGVLTQYVNFNKTKQVGLFEEVEPVMIVSSDGDMRQLHDLGDVHQWSPIQKKLVQKAPKDFLIEKIIRGDSGDGIPSVLCPDDWFVNEEYAGVRAKAVTQKVIERFKAGVGLTEEEKRRYLRNETLISFKCTPVDVQREILTTYKRATPSQDLNAVMEYFMRVHDKQLIDRIQEFKVK